MKSPAECTQSRTLGLRNRRIRRTSPAGALLASVRCRETGMRPNGRLGHASAALKCRCSAFQNVVFFRGDELRLLRFRMWLIKHPGYGM